MSIKKRIYRIIQPHKKGDIPSIIFDWSIIFLVVIDVLTTILDTLDLPLKIHSLFYGIEIFTVIVFTIEYFLRFWTIDALSHHQKPLITRLKFAFSYIMVVDFLAIAPFYLQFLFPIDIHVLRAFRLLRIFRLVKIKDYIKALSHVVSVIKKKAHQLFISTFILFILMLVASILVYTAENEAQPDVFDNALSGLWWSIVTLTTVGYGDIYPVTVLGKFIGAAFSVLSIGLVAIPIGIISAGFIEHSAKEKFIIVRADTGKPVHDKSKPKKFCPYCGEELDDS